jgi:hypothetical protein
MRENEMEDLIDAAMALANALRNGANRGDRYGARATEAEAERWNGLALRRGQNFALPQPARVTFL